MSAKVNSSKRKYYGIDPGEVIGARLAAIADSKGISYQTLARMILLEYTERIVFPAKRGGK